MGTVSWTKTTAFYNRASGEIISNVNSSDWIGFLDALGWAENSGRYGGVSSGGMLGMYQADPNGVLAYIDFFNSVGQSLLGVTSAVAFSKNPVAQDLAAIMEFSGIPDTTRAFSSAYTATRTEALRLWGLSNQHFDALIGKTFSLSFADRSGNIIGTDTITLTKAGVSAAAHSLGPGRLAQAMSQIYNATFDANGNQTTSIVSLSAAGFADGSGVAFTAYVKLLQNFDISPFLNAPDGANFPDFNAFVGELFAQRKDKIINDLVSKGTRAKPHHILWSYMGTIQSILQGLSLPTDYLAQTNGERHPRRR